MDLCRVKHSTEGYPCKGGRELRSSGYCGCLDLVIDFGQKVEQAGRDGNTIRFNSSIELIYIKVYGEILDFQLCMEREDTQQ